MAQFECPNCRNTKTRTSGTHRTEIPSVTRRRECAVCGHKFTTTEILGTSRDQQYQRKEFSRLLNMLRLRLTKSSTIIARMQRQLDKER